MSGVDYNEEETLLDGKPTPVAQVLIKAWSTGKIQYIASLDQYAVDNADAFISQTLVHLRRIYHIKKFIGAPASETNLPIDTLSDKTLCDRFKHLAPENQKSLLRDCIAILVGEQDEKGNHLFAHKYDWVPISLVLKQRLNQRLTNDAFYAYATEITPSNLPDKLKISKSTMGNSTTLTIHDGRYYEWTDKQLEGSSAKHVHAVCCRFWDIVKRRLYEIS